MGDANITIITINKLIKSDKGINERITDLGVALLSDITFEIEVGYEKVAITVNKDAVGESKLYKPIPSVPKYLVIIILNINPTALPITPPINNTNVDFKNKLFLTLFII